MRRNVEIKNHCVIHIWDKRYEELTDITDGTGRFGTLVYTLDSEDMKEQDKPEFSPYSENYAMYDEVQVPDNGIVLYNRDFETKLHIVQTEEEIVLEMNCDSHEVSACGMFLPLNFMSCKNGTYDRQFLVSSPYHTLDGKYWMHYFTKPDGKNMVLIAEGDIEGYKINYSPYLSGHYIQGFSFLWQLDQVYKQKRCENKTMRVHLVPVCSYAEALEKATAVWKVPALNYEISSVKTGRKFEFEVIRDVDYIKVISPSGDETYITDSYFTPMEYGIYTLVPYYNQIPGMDISVFVWDDMKDMYTRAMSSLTSHRDEILGKSKEGQTIWRPIHLFYRGYHDHNLCEHGMWCWAMLRYMRAYGIRKDYAEEVLNHIRIVLAESEVSLNCCTITEENYFRTQNSMRIQEVYSGVNLLLDAYKLWKEQKYLDSAIRILVESLKRDLSPDGAIMKYGKDIPDSENEDYTTVTCMVFPVVDMAVYLKSVGDERYMFFEQAAFRIADFVMKRGFSFPTEGGTHPEVNKEMEEGSISCSALTVLYVAYYLCANDSRRQCDYLAFAKEILDFHDAYTVNTPHPVMFRSSLRWWETIWEGDADGPAVCFGHAWSIWRAEAQFWYGLLAKDNVRLLDSYNGFMGNYAKEQEDGTVYAIYQYEKMSGGATTHNGSELEYRLKEGFPDKADDTTSRYLFARDFQCWQCCAAFVEIHGKRYELGCHVEEGKIHFHGTQLQILYLGVSAGKYRIETKSMPKIICLHDYQIDQVGKYLYEISCI